MTTGPRIQFVGEPSAEQVEAVLAILSETAEQQRPGGNYRGIGFLLKDDADAIVGGLTGYVLYEWMFIQFLSVAPELRGQGLGEQLLDQAEAWAREQGLLGMWLDTFAFQAPDFYRKVGFTEFGTIADHPSGSRRIFFQKRFA
jgi:GNAT superfamily N-acetyltransferase